jgi:TolA-binding protein
VLLQVQLAPSVGKGKTNLDHFIESQNSDLETQQEVETMKTQIAQLMERNEALQASIETVQQQQQQEKESQHGDFEDPDPQPHSTEIWSVPVLDNFKVPSLTSYDGKGKPVEHVTTFNIRMAVVGAADSLKCKLLAGTLRKATL